MKRTRRQGGKAGRCLRGSLVFSLVQKCLELVRKNLKENLKMEKRTPDIQDREDEK